MKNANLKKIFSTVLAIVVVLSVIFVISSCQHAHTLEEKVVTPATCESSGTIEIKCTDEKCDYVEIKTIPATGHDNSSKVTKTPTCTEDGVLETKCSKCGETNEQKIAAPGHKQKKVPAKAPTCTEEGYEEHIKCESCSWTTLTKDMIIAPLGHISSDWLDDRDYKSVANGKDEKNEYTLVYPTCTEPGYHYNYKECIREVKNSNGVVVGTCGHNLEYVKVDDAALGHDLTYISAVAANCCPGHDAYEYCNGWSTSELKNLGYPNMPSISQRACGYTTYVEHPAVYDHVMTSELEYKETKAATCEAEGAYQLIRRCTTPGCTYSVVEESGVISVLGHEWQTHVGQDATCAIDGWKDFTMCSRCDKIDTPDGQVPVIPAGHKYDDDGCLLVCTACGFINESNGGHQLITKVSEEDGARQNPTCVDAGFYTCIKWCEKCNKAITTEVVRIDPHGHDYISYAGKNPTCTTVGWDAFKACSRCDYSEFKEIPAYGHKIDENNPELLNKRDASCTAEGLVQYGYRCLVCNEIAKTYNETLPILPHTEIIVNELPATCDSAGYSEYSYCGVCRKQLTAKYIYQALGHDIKIIDAQDPTCTEKGWFAYAECQRAGCGYCNKDDMVINALGHDMVFVDTKEPTCTEAGHVAHYDCSRCDYTEGYKSIPAHGHKAVWGDEDIVDPTCTVEGTYNYVYRCLICNEKLDSVAKTIPATGHNYNEITGNCENGCGAFYTPALSFSLTAEGMVVTGMENTTATEIIIPETFRGYKVVGINARAFEGCTKITSIVIPDTVEFIGDLAFMGCKNLSTITVGSGLKKVGSNAFYLCKGITTVNYNGTAADWAKISIDPSENGYFINANRVYLK